MSAIHEDRERKKEIKKEQKPKGGGSNQAFDFAVAEKGTPRISVRQAIGGLN